MDRHPTKCRLARRPKNDVVYAQTRQAQEIERRRLMAEIVAVPEHLQPRQLLDMVVPTKVRLSFLAGVARDDMVLNWIKI